MVADRVHTVLVRTIFFGLIAGAVGLVGWNLVRTRAPLGASCRNDADCDSDVCLREFDGDQGVCTLNCDVHPGACPAPLLCRTIHTEMQIGRTVRTRDQVVLCLPR
jgi:hypothetical protein